MDNVRVNKTNLILGGAFALLLVLGVGYYIYTDVISGGPSIDRNNIDDSGDNSDIVDRPNLDRPIVVRISATESQKEEWTNKIKATISDLDNNDDNSDSWLTLGEQFKQIGDYKRTQEMWEYAAFRWPEMSVTFGNLGVLYGYYLDDSDRAIENFNKAIEINPKLLYLYGRLYDYYREKAKDDAKAVATLRRAIEANPLQEKEIQKIIDNYKPVD